jgi:hypothetical protein
MNRVVCVLCGTRMEFNIFMDNLSFLAAKEGDLKTFSADADRNPILDGVMYVHGHTPNDVEKLCPVLWIITGTFDNHPQAKELYDIASRKTRLFGRMVRMKLKPNKAKEARA